MLFSEIVIFAYVSSGSFYAAVCHNKKFEEVLPLTIMTTVLIGFLMGMMDKLYLGFLACVVFGVFLYVVGGIRLFKTKDYLKIKENFFTSAFFVFSAIYVVIIILNYGKMATNTDEFSHWIECVRSMILLDDFSTNPLSHDSYRSYPPGMALFQYIVQRIYLVFHRNEPFSEWMVYVAYKLFYISLLFPLMKRIDRKNLHIALLAVVGFFLTPSRFYGYVFKTLMIDSFVAMLAGSGLAFVMFVAEKEVFSLFTITLICANLYLAKDVGVFFAIFIIAMYALKINYLHLYETKKKRLIANVLFVGVPIFTLLCFKYMWDFELRMTEAKIVNVQNFKIREFFELLIFHNGTDYKQTIVDNFCNALVDKDVACIPLWGGRIKFNYVLASVVLIGLLILENIVDIYNMEHHDEKSVWNLKNIKFKWLSVGILSFLLVLYVVSIGIFFTSGPEIPSVRLISFSRYMNIAYMALWIYLVANLIWMLSSKFQMEKRIFWRKLCLFLLSMIFLCGLISVKEFGKYVTRANVKESIESRSKFEELSNKILNTCDTNDKIYFVSRGHIGEDSSEHGLYNNIIQFNIEPITLSRDTRNQWDGWALGPALSKEDIWYLDISPEEWFRVLKDEGYTYVAIFRKGDDIDKNYGKLFESMDAVQDDSLYKIDFTNKVLRRVDVDKARD